MSVLLRHGGSRFYFGGRSCWVDGPGRAVDLGTIERAVEAGREEDFGGMEIVAYFGDPDCEFVLPLSRTGTGRSEAADARSQPVGIPQRPVLPGVTTPLPPHGVRFG
jgi:hypothetical protein